MNDAPALILVVDDNAPNRYVACSWLRRHGYEVIEASTGAEALAAVAAAPVDLVVLDVGLPDMTGFDVCEQIKADPALGQPVIHLSATSVRGSDRAHGLTRGADAYLVEPVEPDELIATVASVLRYYRARADAERLAEQLTGLTSATLAMNSATSFDALAAAIANGAADVLATAAAVVVPAPDRTLRRAVVDRTAGGAPHTDIAPAQLLRALADRRGADTGSASFPVPWSLASGAEPSGAEEPGASAVLFESRSGPPLVIVLRTAELPGDSAGLLVQLGHAAVLAADSLRLYTEEHTLALTLQRSFLPAPPSELPGLEIAVRYVPAARNAEIGGDFYEFAEIPDGRLLVAIGDVAGHSIHAATVMVELRHALRAYAVDGSTPGEILDQLERMLQRYHPQEFATLCLLVLDLGRNELSVGNAGHLPPLLVPPGDAEFLPVHGPMLGLGRPRPPDTVVTLPPAWSLVLITDGLVEDRNSDLDDALERLRGSVTHALAPEALCEQLLGMFGGAGLDDIALLALRHRP
jgi:CheY-like chemotaxis protein